MADLNSPTRDTSAGITKDSPLSRGNLDKAYASSGASSDFQRLILGRKLEPEAECVLRLTYLYSCVHGAIDQLLPACFKSLERDMGFSPQALGFVSSASRVAHVLTCPLWGFIIDSCGRRRIFSSSALGWGASAAGLLYVTQQWHLVLLMCSLGIFMAAMGPLSQKVIAQEVPEAERGRSFGMLHFFQSFGRVMSLTITTSVAGFTFWGIQGWRHAFVAFGLLSVYMGIILATCVADCPHQRKRNKERGHWFSPHEIAYVFSNGSVWVMLLMGILNGIPRSALHFSTMYFQYCNLPGWWASFIVSSSWIAAMVVAPFIGCAGDYVHSKYPNHGRQCLAQVCIILRCALMTVMLICVPRQTESLWSFFVLAILLGFLAGWPGVGVNRPILTEIVKPEHRATTFAMVSCLEGVGAATLGAPIVGYMCENVYGYVKPAHGQHFQNPPEAIRLGNAQAIAFAMLSMTVGPWLLNVLAYGILHLTYKFDSRHGSASKGKEAAARPRRSHCERQAVINNQENTTHAVALMRIAKQQWRASTLDGTHTMQCTNDSRCASHAVRSASPATAGASTTAGLPLLRQSSGRFLPRSAGSGAAQSQ
ncbi:hypothetical protein Esti_005894 [Eimeria stiedai]